MVARSRSKTAVPLGSLDDVPDGAGFHDDLPSGVPARLSGDTSRGGKTFRETHLPPLAFQDDTTTTTCGDFDDALATFAREEMFKSFAPPGGDKSDSTASGFTGFGPGGGGGGESLTHQAGTNHGNDRDHVRLAQRYASYETERVRRVGRTNSNGTGTRELPVLRGQITGTLNGDEHERWFEQRTADHHHHRHEGLRSSGLEWFDPSLAFDGHHVSSPILRRDSFRNPHAVDSDGTLRNPTFDQSLFEYAPAPGSEMGHDLNPYAANTDYGCAVTHDGPYPGYEYEDATVLARGPPARRVGGNNQSVRFANTSYATTPPNHFAQQTQAAAGAKRRRASSGTGANVGAKKRNTGGGGGSRGGNRSTSKYRGVTHHCRTGRWEAHIWENGKQVYLGGFDSGAAVSRLHTTHVTNALFVQCISPNTVHPCTPHTQTTPD